MSSRNELYYFIDARQSDEKDMLEILEEPDFSGDISIIYTRRPSPLASLMKEGKQVKVLLCKRKDTEELVGFGVGAIRDFYVSGKKETVGYLSGLRVKKSYRKKFVPITKAYKLLGEWLREESVALVYTTVLEENTDVIKMFSKRRKHMPDYNPLDRYIVYSPSTRLKRVQHELSVRPVKFQELSKLEAFLRGEGLKSDFYPMLTEADLKGKTYLALDYEKFYVALEGDEIVACAYVQDRHDDKQHILHAYSGKYKALQYLSPVLPLVGYPKLPREGSLLKYYNVAFLSVKDKNPKLMDLLIREIAYMNRHYDYFLVGLVEKDPFNAVMSKMSKVTYRSQLYNVDYAKTEDSKGLEEKLKNIYIECGLL